MSPHSDQLGHYNQPFRDKLSLFVSISKFDFLTIFSQCIAIYGKESFKKLHQFLHEARSNGMDEAAIYAGLKKIADNTRDCFLIDQLIFLEKQHTP